jgi:nitrogen fixation protein
MIVKQGQTDVTTYFKLINATTGLPEVGLVAADIALEYIRDRDLSIPIIAGDISRAQDHEDGGIVGFSNGIYRVDWPDAAFASGVDKVQLMVIGDDIDIAIMEAELEIISDSLFPDEVFDPAAGTIRYNKKGTVTQLSKKDLKDPAGDPVNSTEDIIAEATEQ